jgi:AraC family transcriptional regulator of adaptative response/methylated-DNA-[protein]-cysteine methyltransferase
MASVFTTSIDTPVGEMLAAASETHLLMFEFAHRRLVDTQIARVRALAGCALEPGESPLFAPLRQQMAEYFAGERQEFDLPLDARGTPFQMRVWAALQRIPCGTTSSYGRVAAAIGQPTAVRAVARANGDNRIAIIIPCHRVIGADGQLVGYGGGLPRKKKLLELEARGAALSLFER